MTNYDKICQASRQLSTAEQIKVLQYIESLQNGDGGVDRTSSSEPETSSKENQVQQERKICPHCSSKNVIKYGHKRGKQRYYCKDCETLFMVTTGTIMAHSHYDESIWREVLADTINGFIPLDKTADRLGLSHNTAFNMRHKALMSMEKKEKMSPVVLQEISELDETYVLESFKGIKLPINVGRKPRKHGAKAKMRGISNEQICIMAGVQRNGGPAYATTINRAHPSKDEIERAFKDHIDTGCVAFTDGLKGYKHLESVIDCVVESVSVESQKNSGTANLNNVNGFHSFIQERYEHYRGVATHYINRYNALFALAFRAKESISNIIDSILHGTDTGSFSYWDVKNSALVNL